MKTKKKVLTKKQIKEYNEEHKYDYLYKTNAPKDGATRW